MQARGMRTCARGRRAGAGGGAQPAGGGGTRQPRQDGRLDSHARTGLKTTTSFVLRTECERSRACFRTYEAAQNPLHEVTDQVSEFQSSRGLKPCHPATQGRTLSIMLTGGCLFVTQNICLSRIGSQNLGDWVEEYPFTLKQIGSTTETSLMGGRQK